MAVYAGGGVKPTTNQRRDAAAARRAPKPKPKVSATNQRRDAAMARRAKGPSPKPKARPRPQPAPKRYASPGRGSSAPRPGGGGSMGYSGGGRGVPSAPAIEGPGPIKSEKDWLAGDSTYLSQIANFSKALQDFKANQGLSRSQYDTQYGTDKKSLQDALTKGQADMKDDFAGRGLLQSGLYTDALGNLNTEFQTQFGQLDTNKKNFMDNLTREFANFNTESEISKNQARADALRRRAAEYGI